jgi:hypothetical protein
MTRFFRAFATLSLLIGTITTDSAYAYLHSNTGRFLQRDPAGFADGTNVYAYLAAAPIAAVDPHGMWKRDSKWIYSDKLKRAIAICEPGDTLEDLAESITNVRTDWTSLGLQKTHTGAHVNVIPLLEKMEMRLRESVVSNADKLKLHFGDDKSSRMANEADIRRWFEATDDNVHPECFSAAALVMAKALIDNLRPGEYDHFGYKPTADPGYLRFYAVGDRTGATIKIGDWGPIRNYKDYRAKVPGGAYQAENVIKVANNLFWGFDNPPKKLSFQGWEDELRTQYNAFIDSNQQRHDPIPGFDPKHNSVKSFDVAKIAMRVFKQREDQRKQGH